MQLGKRFSAGCLGGLAGGGMAVGVALVLMLVVGHNEDTNIDTGNPVPAMISWGAGLLTFLIAVPCTIRGMLSGTNRPGATTTWAFVIILLSGWLTFTTGYGAVVAFPIWCGLVTALAGVLVDEFSRVPSSPSSPSAPADLPEAPCSS